MVHPQRRAVRALDVIREREAAATLLQPLRQQILEGLRQPESASGIARRLGLPRQKVNYHLRELEKGGFVELVEERRRGNCTERVVRATARSYLISPEALGALGSDPEKIQDRFSAAYLVATAGQAVREVGEMQGRAAQAGKRLATLTLASEVRFASADKRNAFTEELAMALAGLAAKYHDEGAPEGRRFRFFVGGYPAPAPRGHKGKAGPGGSERVTGDKGGTA
jgi:DNA-binding transcriptional ArsR family regulator